VRRVSSLALPAFLASAASTLSLQDDIMFGYSCSDSVFLQSYLTDWSTSFGAIPETLPRDNRFETVQISWQTKLGWSPAGAHSWGWLLFWQPRHHIVGIGFSPCPHHLVVWDSTTKQCKSESVCGLVRPIDSLWGDLWRIAKIKKRTDVSHRWNGSEYWRMSGAWKHRVLPAWLHDGRGILSLLVLNAGRSSHQKAVCPSVKRVNCDRTEERSV